MPAVGAAHWDKFVSVGRVGVRRAAAARPTAAVDAVRRARGAQAAAVCREQRRTVLLDARGAKAAAGSWGEAVF